VEGRVGSSRPGGGRYTLVMRIIAGQWRGRTIEAPAHKGTRPILDRAKTVLFDVLGHRLARPGRLPPVAVLDLFAGSGALGLESLSRGARFCLFIEQDRKSAHVLRGNLDRLQIIKEAHLIQGDAASCLWPAPPPDDQGMQQYELVFMDPPYRLLAGNRPAVAIQQLLRRLASDPVIAPRAVLVTRHEVQPGGGPDLAPLVEVDRRDVGTMTLRFLTFQLPPPAPPLKGGETSRSQGGETSRSQGGETSRSQGGETSRSQGGETSRAEGGGTSWAHGAETSQSLGGESLRREQGETGDARLPPDRGPS
jgi:16S rRNA (guanine966-N2)-methyltransferase